MSILDLFEIKPEYETFDEWDGAKSDQELCEFEENILDKLIDEKEEMIRSSITRNTVSQDEMRRYLERLEQKTDLIYQREVLPVKDKFEGSSGNVYGINCREVIEQWYSI